MVGGGEEADAALAGYSRDEQAFEPEPGPGPAGRDLRAGPAQRRDPGRQVPPQGGGGGEPQTSAGAGGGRAGGGREDMRRNTSVYVEGLPNDATVAEVFKHFSSKCGIIKQDGGEPRVKFYTDAEGKRKGDGLISFLKPPSVDLALALLDGVPLRPGAAEPCELQVSPAQFEKGLKYVADPKKRRTAAGSGMGMGGRKKPRRQDRELAWDGSDEQLPSTRVLVVLRGMFTLEEAYGDAAFGPELEADVKEECSKMGRVDQVRAFVRHPDGVVTVLFHFPDEAEACVARMHGRYFGGHRLEAALHDGYTNFWAESLPKPAAEPSPAEARRLEAFARDLEADPAPGPAA